MKTLTIATGPQWTVAAVCDNQGRCPTLSGMENHPLEPKMLALIQKAATSGPQRLKVGVESKDLGDGIFEFRRRPSSGAHLRVLWFYDRGRIVVCTHAFVKAGKKTPPREIEKAQRIRERYLREKAS